MTWFGIWYRNNDIINEPDGENAIIDGRAIYCPICKQQMRMWIEGCSLLHIICKNCKLKLIMVLKNKEIYKNLEKLVYDAL